MNDDKSVPVVAALPKALAAAHRTADAKFGMYNNIEPRRWQ